MKRLILWAMTGFVPLSALTLTPGCSILARDTSAEDRIADAEAILAVAREVGPKLVERGAIKQEELDIALNLLETALDLYKASLEQDDAVRRAELRARVLSGIIKVATLIASA